MSKIYLAYGSNLNKEQMAFRCPTAKVVGTTFLEGYKLVFRGSRSGAVATVEPSKNDDVPVMIWEIQDLDEKALDIYEGYPRLYVKRYVEVQLDGEPVEVMMYVMTEGRPFGIPHPRYYYTILHGYREAMFDEAYLNEGVEYSREEFKKEMMRCQDIL